MSRTSSLLVIALALPILLVLYSRSRSPSPIPPSPTTNQAPFHDDVESMSGLKAGDSFPEGIAFQYVAPKPENSDITSCGVPVKYDASKEFKNKKVVLVAVPGAFTPTCQAQHIPGYIQKLKELKSKGVDAVIIIGYNDAWVMSAWGKANGIKDDAILFMSDASLSGKIGWTLGERTARYAIIVDKGKVTYAEKESGGEVTVSGVDAVLAKL